VRLKQEELLVQFEDYLRYERRYSVHTLECYLSDSRQLCHYLATSYAIHNLDEATHHHIRSWIVSLLKEKKQSASVRRKMSSVAHLFKWMRRAGFLTHNPVIKVQLPKIPERLPKSLPQSVLQALWKSLSIRDEEKAYGSMRDQVLVSLLYGCGMRRSEVINITWQDYDESRQLLKVFGKGRKYRQIPVSPELKILLKNLKESALLKWVNLPHIAIILMDNGKPCYPKFVHNKVVGLLGTVTTAEKKSPHTLRHSMATHMMDQGAELNAVKAILGHSSLAATQVYTHNSISRLKEVYRQSHPNAKNNA